MRCSAIAVCGWAVALALLPGGARALDQGVSPAGVAYLSGGADPGEQRLLRDVRSHYSVWLIMRSEESGRPLGDVRVRVLDARQRHSRLVFDRMLVGPWLLLDLPDGRYQIEATWDDELRRWAVAPRHHDAVPHALFFEVAA
jgi:hypothetical protein